MASRFRRYSVGARWYDALSGERLVYSAGREAGVDLLDPVAGDVVIDLGCGTGLNFPALADAVGPGGLVVGIDRSADMLTMARRRVRENGWDHVVLIQDDAAALDVDRVRRTIHEAIGRDAADKGISTYALSVIDRRADAWDRLSELMRPRARVCIVDMQLPVGRWRLLAPLARLACATGGADIGAHPWRMLERDAVDGTTRRTTRKGGHIVAVAGDLP